MTATAEPGQYLCTHSVPHSLKISLNYLTVHTYRSLWIPNAVAKMPFQETHFTGLEAFNKTRSY